jgi:hypothetical protein
MNRTQIATRTALGSGQLWLLYKINKYFANLDVSISNDRITIGCAYINVLVTGGYVLFWSKFLDKYKK